MSTKTEINTLRDWASLAIKGHPACPEGYVYVGNGLNKSNGATYSKNLGFGCSLKTTADDFKSKWAGTTQTWEYFCPINTWEEKTGLNYKEITKQQNKKTMTYKEAFESGKVSIDCKDQAGKDRVINFLNGVGVTNHFNKYFDTSFPFLCYDIHGPYSVGTCTKREKHYNSLDDFLLNGLNTKPGSVLVKMNGNYSARVTKDKIVCNGQNFTHKELESILAAIKDNSRKSEYKNHFEWLKSGKVYIKNESEEEFNACAAFVECFGERAYGRGNGEKFKLEFYSYFGLSLDKDYFVNFTSTYNREVYGSLAHFLSQPLKKNKTVSLSNGYPAEIKEKTVTIGCQTFDIGVFYELEKAVKEVA